MASMNPERANSLRVAGQLEISPWLFRAHPVVQVRGVPPGSNKSMERSRNNLFGINFLTTLCDLEVRERVFSKLVRLPSLMSVPNGGLPTRIGELPFRRVQSILCERRVEARTVGFDVRVSVVMEQ